MSAARLRANALRADAFRGFYCARALFVGLVVVGLLALAARPADALQSEVFGDVAVPYGAVQTEARTVVGDVTVKGRVEGDVRCAFGDVVVQGKVTGDVQSGFGNVYVNGPVGGSVDVGHGDVRLGPLAHVEENLSLGNGRSLTHPAAVVEGERRYGMMSSGSPMIDGGLALANLTLWLLTTLGFCAVAMLFAVLARRPLGASVRSLSRAPGRALLLGIVSLPAVVLFSVLLAVTVVGAPLLLLSVPAYLALVLFGALVAAYQIGRRLLVATGSHRGGEAFASAVGAFAISVVYLVPFVGPLVLSLLALLGTGAAVSAAIERLMYGGSGSYEPHASQASSAEGGRKF